MNQIEKILAKKNWKIDQETKNRLTSLVSKFLAQQPNSGIALIDIKQFSSYFVTHVYKLVCTKNNSPVNFYAKFAYLPKKYEKRQRERIKYEFDYTEKIYDLLKSSDGFDSVQPVAYYESEAAFVMSEMKGERLDNLLVSSMRHLFKSDNTSLYQTMNNSGRWLLEFQTKMPVEGERLLDFSTLESRVGQYIEKIAQLAPELISQAFERKLKFKTSSLLNEFDADDFIQTAKHNDFAPWNLMKGESGIIGFDYADCELDSKYYDVYHYTRALDTFKFKLVSNSQIIEECKQHFLDGYGLKLSASHPTRLYFNLFFSLERVHMLLRARLRNKGVIGGIRTLSQKRHFNWYLNELKMLSS